MKNCAVIGGSGFIGSHLVKALSATKGCGVVSLSRSRPKEDHGARQARVDMTDRQGLTRELASVDTVFHLGATIPNAFVNAPEVVREGNRKGAEAVVAACRAAKVERLVYVTGHLAPPPRGTPGDFAFVEGKVAAEEIIRAANGVEGLATCSVRAPVIFGPGDSITTAYLRGEAPALPGFACTFGFMYVDDLVPLLLLAADKLAAHSDLVAGAAIDVRGERMMFEAFFSQPAWGRPPPRFLPYRAVRALAAFNAWCARLAGKAPLGASLCPAVLDSMALHQRKEGGRAAVEALEIAAEAPRSVEAGIRDYVARSGR
jgi:3beta-hydroxy-delta5-steroid dehydrogenase/steroid delta-isomerase